MAKYIVKDGHKLGHQGAVLSGGDVVELAEDVAADGAVWCHIDKYNDPPRCAPDPPVVPKPRITPVVMDSKTS